MSMGQHSQIKIRDRDINEIATYGTSTPDALNGISYTTKTSFAYVFMK